MGILAFAALILSAQIAIGVAIGFAFRRAWRRALATPADFPSEVPTLPIAAELAGVGAYLPDHQQPVVATAFGDRRSLASLAVHLHEIGHHRQHFARPLAVRVHWPLRMIATLAGGLGTLITGWALLDANPGLGYLGVVLCGANTVAAGGLVLLEWDASRRGVAILAPGRYHVQRGLLSLLALAALTYLSVAWCLILPIWRPETACSLPSTENGPDSPLASYHAA
ncbi:MAG TPA: zinc metallopeptidase, partial [Chloroflexota bacterium]|nr:zinc metallopeptidase [Chloroflexota bacterium]